MLKAAGLTKGVDKKEQGNDTPVSKSSAPSLGGDMLSRIRELKAQRNSTKGNTKRSENFEESREETKVII